MRRDYPERRSEAWDVADFGDERVVVLADFMKKRKKLPKGLEASPHMTHLQVPRHLADQLRESHVRNLLGDLELRGEGTCDLSRMGLAKGITSVGGYKCIPMFEPASFPALRLLSTWQKNKTRLFTLIDALPKLRSLFVPAHPELLLHLPPRLGFLQVLWGALESLAGASRLSELEWLMIDRVAKLRSLDGLEGHPTLKKIDLTHCPLVTDVTPLTSCPSLRYVSINYCKALAGSPKSPSLVALAKLLASRGGALEVES